MAHFSDPLTHTTLLLKFAIFDTVMGALGATKYHFHDPSKH